MDERPVEMPIHEVLTIMDWLLDKAVIYQINGGWAVDALVGRQTRTHRDLDLFVDSGVVDELITWLGSKGYAVTEDWRPVRLELTAPQGRVDVHPMVVDANHDGVQASLSGEPFVHRAADRTTGRLCSVDLVVANARRLIELHSALIHRP